MNVSFSVAMMLQAVNNMGPGVQSAQRMIKSLGNEFKSVAQQSSNLNPVQGWENKINKVADAAKRIGKELKSAGQHMSDYGDKMQTSGMKNVIEGAGMMAPVMVTANKAAELQMKQTSLRMSGVSTEGVSELMQKADKYTERTLFSKTEIADMFLSMRQSGMKEQNILRGSESMVMLAELENIRRGTDGKESAKILSQMAERGGVLRDPNIKRWEEFLEIVNQVTTVTTAGLAELHESSKYLEPVASIAGWNEKDMMMSQGIAARFGLEGSIAGTDLKDMISRLNPYKWFKEGRPDQHLDAMQRLGWLTGVEAHEGRGGRTAYDRIGGSVMMNEDGTTKNMLEVFAQFAKSYEQYKDLPQGKAKFASDMFKVLGEQGEKTALLVAQNYETIKQMIEDADKVKPIHDQITEYSKEYLQNYKAFKNSIENLEIEAGVTLLPALTEASQTLRGWLQSAREFTKAHPDLVGGFLKLVLALGAFKMVAGVGQLIFGTLLGTFGGGAAKAGLLSTGVSAIGKGLVNLKTGFDLVKGTGAGFWTSLWQGAQLAFPWLARIAAFFSGPLGWAVLGATTVIAGAVWAWNNDFMGFRTKAKATWDGVTADLAEDIKQWSDLISRFSFWAGQQLDAVRGKGAMLDERKVPNDLKNPFDGAKYGGKLDESKVHGSNLMLPNGGSGQDLMTVNQTNNITVKNAEEAADYTRGALPDKYAQARNPIE